MSNNLNLYEKTVHAFNGTALFTALFFPSFLKHIAFSVVLTALLAIVIIAYGIYWYQQHKSPIFSYYPIQFIVCQCIYCIFIWLSFSCKINPMWMLAGLLWTLAIFYISIYVRKHIEITNVQYIIEIAICFIVTYVHIL